MFAVTLASFLFFTFLVAFGTWLLVRKRENASQDGFFLPSIMKHLGIQTMTGICLAENTASIRVLEHCGFQEQFRGMAEYQGKPAQVCRFLYKLA